MEQHPDDAGTGDAPLCASCDRCRARKTKCDGQRPCGNCVTKYMKKNKVSSIEGIELKKFECVYSPAKRRGPVPGRSSGAAKHKNTQASSRQKQEQQQQQNEAEWQGTIQQIAAANNNAAAAATMVDPAQLAAFLSAGASTTRTTSGSTANSNFNAAMDSQASIQQQLSILQQLQLHQAQKQQQQPVSNLSALSGSASADEPSSQRVKLDKTSAADNATTRGIPRTIMAHTHLLERSDPDGSRLRAYFKLSIDELFRLPLTPNDEEYCLSLNVPGLTPSMIPGSHLAALSAVRFAEVALGALVHNEVSLAMELCNAVVHCLRESVQEPVQIPAMFEVAKAYFLLGVFRACRGDMARYFKYRRVCLTYLSKLENANRTNILLAAVSYLDSWAYMIYNANEEDLPDVDDTIPPVQKQGSAQSSTSEAVADEIESKYDIKTDPTSIVCDPKNKNWIQGAPPVYLNNEAPAHARVLDALACAVRTCCDQANTRFAEIAKEVDASAATADQITGQSGSCSLCTPTTTATSTAVLANENELCSRNMVLSAYTLMQSSENQGQGRNEGHHLVISAMDAFLENGDESVEGGFTDSQIQSLLSVCNTAVENPFLLHHAGPTYHMVSNAAVLLCHILNGMHAAKSTEQFGAMEATMFEEVLDTFISIRKLLTIHRRKLPVMLRCHGIPRPSFGSSANEKQPFVDLGETLLCPCRGCQGFVLMACSPCVAAERALAASSRMNAAAAQEAEAVDMDISDLGAEFDLDDDALLNMISNLIST